MFYVLLFSIIIFGIVVVLYFVVMFLYIASIIEDDFINVRREKKFDRVMVYERWLLDLGLHETYDIMEQNRPKGNTRFFNDLFNTFDEVLF